MLLRSIYPQWDESLDDVIENLNSAEGDEACEHPQCANQPIKQLIKQSTWAACALLHSANQSTNEQNNLTTNSSQPASQPEDGEAGEQPHGASNQSKLSLQRQLSISLNLIVAGRHKVDLD